MEKAIKILNKFIEEKDEWGINKIFSISKQNNIIILILTHDDNKVFIEETIKVLCEYSKSNFDDNSSIINGYEQVKSISNDIKKHIESKNKEQWFEFIEKLFQSVLINEFIKKNRVKCINKIEDKYLYFRGQSNKNWKLIPSMFRGLQEESLYIDEKYVINQFEKYKLIEKYENVFGKTDDYNLFAFFQHTCCFSPLIDFTKDINIAKSFALLNKNRFYEYYNIPSKLFLIEEIKEEYILNKVEIIDKFIKNDFNIFYLYKKGIVMGERIDFVDSKGKKHAKFIRDFGRLFKFLTPKYKLIDYPLNDRMRYQKGVFLVFYDCLIFNDRVFYELCEDLNLCEYIVDVCLKNNIVTELNSKRKYDSVHIMEPYLLFDE